MIIGLQPCIGVSVKACKNNAQVDLTTSSAFCDMLRANGIPVTADAETGLKMFCGDPGYNPADGFQPKDSSNIPSNKKRGRSGIIGRRCPHQFKKTGNTYSITIKIRLQH